MGYRMPERTALLKFEGGPFEGAEVRVRIGLTIGEYFAFMEHYDSVPWRESLAEVVAHFVAGWNLEDASGQALPLTQGGAYALDADFGLLLLKAWFGALHGTPTPLGSPQPDAV